MLRLPSVLGVPLVLAVYVLSIVSLGLPATLLLVGGWLLAAAMTRHVRGLDGPVAWAAAVVVAMSLVSGLGLLLAEVSPHEHGRLPSLLVLGSPAVVGALGLLTGTLVGRRRKDERVRRPARAAVAATITAAGLVVPMWVASHGVNYRVAWAGSGDARNHALIVREILHAGGLTPLELRNYPAVIDALTGLLSAAGGRHALLPGQLMLHDLRALATTYVVAGIALACLFAAVLLELLPRSVALLRRLPAAVVVTVLAAASLSTTALVLGTSLLDGYVSSYGTLPLTLAATVLAIRCCDEPSPAAFALLGPAAVLTFFSWTLLAVAPMVLVVLTGVVVLVLRRRTLRAWSRRTGVPWLVAVAVSGGAVLVLAVGTWTHADQLHRQFEAPGSITPPRQRLLWLLAFLAVGLVAGARDAGLRRRLLVPLAATAASIATVRFLLWVSPDGQTWTYYASKTLALAAATLIWLPFVPLVLALGRQPVDEQATEEQPAQEQPPSRRGRSVGHVFAAVAGSLAVLVLVSWSTTLTSPLQKARNGWNQPNAHVLTEDAQQADAGHRFLIWHLTDGGNDRLGDFWAALAWSYQPDLVPFTYGPNTLGGIEYWAYIETGALHDLCKVAKDVDNLYVLTSDAKLKASIARSCPNLGMHVLVRRSAA